MVESVQRPFEVGSGQSSLSIEAHTVPPVTVQPAELAATVARIAAGDQAALADFHAATSPTVTGLAVATLGGNPEAEVLTEKVYAHARVRAPAFDAARETPTNWLMAIVREQLAHMAISSTMARRQTKNAHDDVSRSGVGDPRLSAEP
jgi:hypothetical protein